MIKGFWLEMKQHKISWKDKRLKIKDNKTLEVLSNSTKKSHSVPSHHSSSISPVLAVLIKIYHTGILSTDYLK
jgi:hypothetical protein